MSFISKYVIKLRFNSYLFILNNKFCRLSLVVNNLIELITKPY